MRSVSNLFFYLRKYFLINEDDKKFFSSEVSKGEKPLGNGEKVLIDCSHAFYPYWNFKACLIKRAVENNGREVDALLPSRMYMWLTKKSLMATFLDLFCNKNKRIVKKLKYSNVKKIELINIKYSFKDFGMALKCWQSLKTPEDVLLITHEGVRFGDLIYDTYLKFFKSPTVDIGSMRLLYVIYLFFLYERRVQRLLSENTYKEIYLTHAVYLAFGVLARVGLSKGIDVYVYQNHRSGFCKKLSLENPMQTPSFEKYNVALEKLNTEKFNELRALAKEKLKERFEGKIGNDISYMRNSFYGSGNTIKLSSLDIYKDSPRVIVYLHCFFDSPHIYKWMLFPDFWIWLEETLLYLTDKKVNVYVKRHPNALPGNEDIVRRLSKKFTSVHFLPAEIDNGSLVEENDVSLAITVYGTVAHEMAMQGVPVINAGANPHEAFNFSLTPRTRSEYFNCIENVLNGTNPTTIHKESIIDFYIANYLIVHNISVPEWDQVFGPGPNTLLNYSDLLLQMPEEKFNKSVKSLSYKVCV